MLIERCTSLLVSQCSLYSVWGQGICCQGRRFVGLFTLSSMLFVGRIRPGFGAQFRLCASLVCFNKGVFSFAASIQCRRYYSLYVQRHRAKEEMSIKALISKLTWNGTNQPARRTTHLRIGETAGLLSFRPTAFITRASVGVIMVMVLYEALLFHGFAS